MKMKSILLGGLSVLFSTVVVLAHSPIKSTSPENEAKLDVVPEVLLLNFAKPVRVLKVLMTHSTSDESHETRIKIPTKEVVEKMNLTPEFMGVGNYKVKWRALGADGHVIKGDFTFDVAG